MKIELAVTTAFHNKQNLLNKRRAYAYNFKNQYLTTQEIVAWVTLGKSICVATVRDGHRRSSNFISSQFIGIDVDSGEISSVDALTQIPFIKNHAFFVGPTTNSTLEEPRSRIFFGLDRAITDGNQYSEYVTRVMAHLVEQGVEPDKSCKDNTRLYHGSTVQGFWEQHSNILSLDDLDKLPALQKKRDTKPKKKKTNIQSKKLNKAELNALEREIRTALSYIPAQQDYPEWLQILMAVYDVLPNQRGVALIEEWSPGYAGEVAEKFQSFASERSDTITIKTLWWKAKQNGWREGITLRPDKLVTERYVSNVKLDYTKSWIIRSDMATGKSEMVRRAIKQLIQQKGEDIRVIILSHRISLSGNLANRYSDLGFELYSSLNNEDVARPARLICTPNSLHKIKNWTGKLVPYDLIIIDEFEQVLAHLAGDTFEGNEGVTANNILHYLIKNASCVLGLDAHASDLSFQYLQSIRSDVHYLVNTYTVHRGDMHLLSDKDEWLTQLVDIIKGRIHPVVIACDEKNEVKLLTQFLAAQGIRNIMSVHSDNSNSENVRGFLANIDEQMPKYSVLIYSPTMGTGVDVQAEVDAVFGNFGGRSITAEEQHQMLVRFRQAPEFYVHFKTINHKKEIREKEIYTRHYNNLLRTSQLAEFDMVDGHQTITDSQKRFLHLTSKIEASRNRDMNQMLSQFMLLAQRNFNVQEVSYRKGGVLEMYERLEKDSRDALDKLVFSEKPIAPDEYEQLKRTEELSLNIEAGHMRWQIEDTYGQPISPELYNVWDKGKGRAKLLLFMDIYQPRETMVELDRQEERKQVAWSKRRHMTQKWDAIHGLLSTIFGEDLHHEPIAKEDFEAQLAGEFSERLKEYEQTIYGVFNRRVKPEKDESLLVLRWILRKIGLKLKTIRHGKDKKRITYSLDKDSMELMRELAQTRAKAKNISINLSQEVFKK